MGLIKKIFKGASVASVVGAGLFAVDIQRKRVYEDQTFSEAAKHYFTMKSLAWLGSVYKRKLERATKDVAAAQEEFLLQQLRDNADTEYGRRYDFASIKTADDFIRVHPLTRYNHFKPYVDRMMAGEENVLTKDKPTVFAVTSGTSGTGSIIPMVNKQRKLFFLEGISVVYRCMVDAHPETQFLNKDLKIFYNPTWRMSEAGIKIGPNSSSPSESKSLLHTYSTPEPAFEILTEPEALYVHLLFALRDRHLGMIEANFASLIFNAFKTLEDDVSNLARDIEQGTLNPNLNIKTEVREKLEALLTPDAARAGEIRKAFSEGIEGVARKIWPELHILLTCDTGAFTLYGKKLRETYCKDVPLYSPIYAASEGLIGVNIWPTDHPARYLLHPRAQFFEFIRLKYSDQDQPQTVMLHQTKMGKLYELVITNPSCMYRYRFGDVVRVVGYHNECPIIEFMYRQGQFMNVRGEKTSESLFYEVLCDTVAQWPGTKLMDYCCAESIVLEDTNLSKYKTKRPCYHVFLELETGTGKTPQLTAAQRRKLDVMLSAKSYPYMSFRKKGSIGEMQVHLVKPGSFRELRDFMLETTSASANQYKVPRVLKRKEAVEFMFTKLV